MRTLTSTRAIFLTFLLVSSATACRAPMPCPDCDSADDMQADDMQKDPDPDLPCGGADFLNDPHNCGACGNECVEYPGTEWEVGSCQMGVCTGPFWSRCANETSGATCAEICYAGSCVAKGCSGNTALLFFNSGDFQSCSIPDETPDMHMDGPCDEPIPWEQGYSFPTYALCCCG